MPVRRHKILKLVKRRLPILKWAPAYNGQKLVSDAIAGTTVALTVIPQALAYATLGGLEPQFGLYSAFVGCFVYILFGSCKEITIGPTALMALMTYGEIQNRNSDYAVLLCFVSGLVQLVMATLNLGILIDFISIPVTVGFTSATSVIIAVSQLKGLLGLNFSSSGFGDTLVQVCRNLGNVKAYDCALGITCVLALMALRRLKDVKVCQNDKGRGRVREWMSRALWLVSTSRNALVVVSCSVLAYLLKWSGVEPPFALTGSVKAGFPQPGLPPFSTTLANSTATVSLGQMMADLGTSAFLVPLIALLGNVAIAKAFAGGHRVDATQEMLTLSLSNVIGSFFSSMPVTGSFSRSAVNHASGVQTQLGGFFTGSLVVLALAFLTPYFGYIPKAALSAVIICAVIFMIEYEIVEPMWRANRKDLIPTFATFVLCLGIGVELGILVGVALDVVFLLYPSARPEVCVEKITTKNKDTYCLITPRNSLHFPCVEFIKSNIRKAGVTSSRVPLVLDCRYVLAVDFTAAKGIAALVAEFTDTRQPIYFVNLRDGVVSIFKEVIVDDFRFFESEEELDAALGTRPESTKALLRSEQGLEELSEIASIPNSQS